MITLFSDVFYKITTNIHHQIILAHSKFLNKSLCFTSCSCMVWAKNIQANKKPFKKKSTTSLVHKQRIGKFYKQYDRVEPDSLLVLYISNKTIYLFSSYLKTFILKYIKIIHLYEMQRTILK